MKKEYVCPQIELIRFNEEEIKTAETSVIGENGYVDATDFF